MGEAQSSLPDSSTESQRCPPPDSLLNVPAVQKEGDQALLLFPLRVAYQNVRGSHNIYWHDMASPWFRLDIEAGIDSHQEQLRLYEVHSDSNMLCGSVLLSQLVLSDGDQSYLVDNSQLRARTNGLNMRTRKSMEIDCRSAFRMIAWGQMVVGKDCGDNWLQVNEDESTYYLPMEIDGKKIVVPANTAPTSNDIDILSARGVLLGKFRWKSEEEGEVRTHAYTVLKNGSKIADAQIPGSYEMLLDARQGNEKLAHVDVISMSSGKDHEMLELLVEHIDPVVMLMGAIAMLRRLPPRNAKS